MHGWRGRLGVIVPANNGTAEPEMSGVLQAGVSLHGSRVAAPRGTTPRDRLAAEGPRGR